MEAEAGGKMKKSWTVQSDKPGPNHAPAAYRLYMQPWTNDPALVIHL